MQNRREFLLAITGSALALAPVQTRRNPNIVFFLIDDLGWADVGVFGSRYYETPNVDRLAAGGMRFTDAYAACPVCSPTRASIMTGKYPARLHITDWIPGEGDNNPANVLRVPEWTKYLPLEQVTLAEALKSTAYTCASVGKWHLGGAPYLPENQGFDVNVAGGDMGHPGDYFWPYEGGRWTVPGLKEGGQPGEYLTDRLTNEALSFIRRNRNRPFFLYFPHYAVHRPLKAKDAVIAKYKAKPPHGGQRNPTYAAMIESVDQSVGRVLDLLDQLGLAQNTVVVFMSDNGGLTRDGVTSNAPLRDGKGFPYEGGIREPLIVRWPGTVKPGAVCSVPVSSIDFYPTLLEIAGTTGDSAHNRDVDGVSFLPLLKQTGSIAARPLFWHYPHYWAGNTVRPFGAVREGDWKLIEFYEDMRVELYNLAADMGETRNLAATDVEPRERLRKLLHDWRRDVGAQMPRRP